MQRCLATLILLAAAMGGCRSNPGSVLQDTPEQVLARLERDGRRTDAALGGGRVRYLGFEASPKQALPGDTVQLTHYWLATTAVDRPFRVFVHFLLDGARGYLAHGDHDPVPPTDRWPVGRVVRSEHSVRLPSSLPADAVELRLGLYDGPNRMPVDDPALQDGQNRIRAGSFPVAGDAVPRPSYEAHALARPPTLDGTIDDAEWGDAAWIDGFVPSVGTGTPRVRTRVRMAWDPEHLYLAFDCEDPDIQGTLSARDAPVYREEAVEIFIDANRDRRDYVELQASPRGTQFDAAFQGGPRRNMQVAWNGRYRVATAVDGTIGDGEADRGWRSEWAIDVASLPGVTALADGDQWRINLFRVAKDRIRGRQLPDESAWSPPLMGDFHNLERFGDLWFKSARAAPVAAP